MVLTVVVQERYEKKQSNSGGGNANEPSTQLEVKNDLNQDLLHTGDEKEGIKTDSFGYTEDEGKISENKSPKKNKAEPFRKLQDTMKTDNQQSTKQVEVLQSYHAIRDRRDSLPSHDKLMVELRLVLACGVANLLQQKNFIKQKTIGIRRASQAPSCDQMMIPTEIDPDRMLTEIDEIMDEVVGEDEDKPFSQKTNWHKFLHIVDLPYVYLLYITALPVDAEHYSYKRALCYPIPGVYLIMYAATKEAYNIYFLTVGLPLVVILYIIFLTMLRKEEPPAWFMVFTIIGIIAALIYTFLLVEILIAMLNMLGMI